MELLLTFILPAFFALIVLAGAGLMAVRKVRPLGLLFCAGGLAALWLVGLSLVWQNGPEPRWSDGRAVSLEPLIEKSARLYLKKNGGPGLVVAVVSGERKTVMAFGYPSLLSSEPVNGKTLFELGSITKTFTGLCLARAFERKSLHLDQPVQEILPAGIQLPTPAQVVTLKHLTTHTSGFPRLPSNYPLLKGWLRMWLYGGNPYAGYSEEQFKEALQKVELKSKPGETAQYSNFGVGLLGYVLSRKQGVPYDDLVQREICEPLGLRNTRALRPEDQGEYARGYRGFFRAGPVGIGLRAAPWAKPDSLAGAGSLNSSGEDMLRYLEAHMRPGNTPLAESLKSSHHELYRESSRTAYGMGWIRTTSRTLNKTLIWHNGATGGFNSFIGFIEEGNVGIAIMTNGTESVDDLGFFLIKELIR